MNQSEKAARNVFEVSAPELRDQSSNYLPEGDQSLEIVSGPPLDAFLFTRNNGYIKYYPVPGRPVPVLNQLEIVFQGVSDRYLNIRQNGAIFSLYDTEDNLIELSTIDLGYDIRVVKYYKEDGRAEVLADSIGFETTSGEIFRITFRNPPGGAGMSIYGDLIGRDNPVLLYEDTIDGYAISGKNFCLGTRMTEGMGVSNVGSLIVSVIGTDES